MCILCVAERGQGTVPDIYFRIIYEATRKSGAFLRALLETPTFFFQMSLKFDLVSVISLYL